MAKKTVTKRVVEVSINPYELMLILSPDLRETEITKKLKEIVDIIEKAGGKITNEDFWGKKALAYRIKKHNEGIYMVYNIELPNNFLNELKGFLRIEKEVLRSMILSLPANYVYTKYNLDASEEPRERKEKSKKNISVKHNAPAIPPKKKEEKIEVEKKEEKPAPDSDSGKKESKEESIDSALPTGQAGQDDKVEKPTSDDTAEPQGEAVEAEDLQPSEDKEEKPTDEPSTKEEKNPVADSEPVESVSTDTVEKTVEASHGVPEEKKEDYETELDKKLDEILGDEDLNL